MVVKMVKMLLQFLTHFQPCNLRYSTREISWNHVYPITPLGPICGSCSSHGCNRRRLSQLQTTDKHNDTIVLNTRVWLEGKTGGFCHFKLNRKSEFQSQGAVGGVQHRYHLCVGGAHKTTTMLVVISDRKWDSHDRAHDAAVEPEGYFKVCRKWSKLWRGWGVGEGGH